MSEKKTKKYMDVTTHLSSSYIHAGHHYSIDEASFVPIDIHETKTMFMIEVEVPGINIEDLKVSLTESDLIIEGTKHEKIEGDGKVNFLCMERSFGPFRRIIRIDQAVDKTNLKACCSDGVLYIKIPKKEERREKTRLITIEKEEISNE